MQAQLAQSFRFVSLQSKTFPMKVNKKTKLNRQAGFTLIELLVVISIMSLLASILLVNTVDARAKARDTKRLQNMSTLSSALETYNIDKGQYPPGETEFPITFPGIVTFNAFDSSNSGSFIPELASSTYIGAPILDRGDPSTGKGIMYYINIQATRQYFSNDTVWNYSVGPVLVTPYCGGQYSIAPYSPMPKYLLVDTLEKLAVPKELQCKGSVGASTACVCVY